MSLELPCITTSLANMALGAENKKELIVAENEKEFVENIEELLNNQTLRQQIGKNARSFVKSNFNWEKSTIELMNNFSIKRT